MEDFNFTEGKYYSRVKLLELKDYVPIDKRYLSSQRAKYIDIPNDGWDIISRDIDIINNENLPTTLRVYKLNSLPFIIIQIMNPYLINN